MKQYIIKQSDIGKGATTPIRVSCEHCESITTEYPFESLGRVIPADVGKICKKVKGYWYVEDQKQFENRTERSK